jgi:hypothetical protein
MSVADLATGIGVTAGELVKKLIGMVLWFLQIKLYHMMMLVL